MLTLHEKISVRGVESLTDAEILSLLLDEAPTSEGLAERILAHFSGSLASIAREDLSRLRMVEGLGLKRAQRLLAAAEWGRRSAQALASKQITITKSQDIIDIFRPQFNTLLHEECWVLYLTVSNRVIEKYRVSQGGVASTVVDPRIVVKRALELLSTQIVLVHNHPSGSVEPSVEDITLTKKIKSAAALFDINIVDHVIISPSAAFSFVSSKLL